MMTLRPGELVAAASHAVHRQLQGVARRRQLELQAADTRAALENRRAAQEQQVKRAQLQVENGWGCFGVFFRVIDVLVFDMCFYCSWFMFGRFLQNK